MHEPPTHLPRSTLDPVVRRLGPAQPLTAAEAARCGQVAGRIQAELRRLVGALPAHARSASAMSRYLGMVRNTCQRVVTALAEPSPTAALLVQVPGVEGLRQFVAAAARAGVDAADVSAAMAAAEQFELLLNELGCSQSRLGERLRTVAADGESGWSGSPATGDEAARRQLFLGAAMCTGRRCEVTGSIYLFRPAPDDPAARERVLIHSVIGHAAAADAAPFMLASWVPKNEPGDAAAPTLSLLNSAPAHGSSEHALLREFSTDPLPMTTVRDDRGQLTTVIDVRASDGKGTRLIDVVTAKRSTHRPSASDLQGRPIRDVWKLINVPARQMIFDVYLHRRLAAACVPSIDLLLWNPNLEVEHRWSMRLPNGPRLELLGPGLRQAPCRAWSRHAELTSRAFAMLDWNPEEFIGFRCETTYPVWRAGYCMSFSAVEPTEA